MAVGGRAQAHPAPRPASARRWQVVSLVLALLLAVAIGMALRSHHLLRAERAARRGARLASPSEPLPVRRLAYLHAVLERPHDVVALIRTAAPALARRLENDRLRGQTDLYRCVAAIEQVVEGRVLGNPEDAVRIDLSRYFRRRRWAWPRSEAAWRRHFSKHPPSA